MLHTNCFRVSSSIRAARCLMPNRHTAPKAVTCFHKKDTEHRETNFGGLIYSTNTVFLSRSCFTSQVKLNCWKCKKLLDRTPSFFCDSCKSIQPPEEGTSYFKIMDCDYTFTLDTPKLHTRYLQLQRTLHPDNFGQKSVKEQEYSESQSALVSKAYKTLLKPLSRGLYMLKLEGMHLKESTDSVAESQFLLELMEVNEALDEAQTPEEVNKIAQDTKGMLNQRKMKQILTPKD
ncbi:iron-sulfur cluster co-chaperone protein HscB isoform X2 [Girardinichthys multiradiatus]|uniref:iron-sulfur cluster co-chaperone protein HscB isoform X2 n=1 Tax=Girardinichthys multiradiatus TaxID=208333 RepID=UPI001FAD9A02|nr:iron-sulfur cluster co-chaperone protein HscB isoform X2 [Girardinichthys multiradiatus]